MNPYKETYKYDRYRMQFQESHWADPEEIKSSSCRVDIAKHPYPAAGIPLFSDGKTAYVDDDDNHSLIFGSTGSKKSRLFVMPMIHMMANAGESFVVTDPKGELYQKTAATAKQNGFDVIALNFRDFLQSNQWNPLKLPYEIYCSGRKDEAIGMLNDLLGSISAASMERTVDIYWIQQSNSLALAILLILFETGKPEEINMGSFVKLCGEYGKPVADNKLYALAKYVDPESVAGMNLEGVIIQAERTKDSIMSSLHAMIRIFILQKNMISMMSESDFSMQEIGKKKTAVYLIIPDEKNTYHFLVTLFIKQCYETMIVEAQKYSSMSLERRLNFVLDEFANIPAIPDMEAMITAARSRNMRFFLVIQSMHQLDKLYGDNAKTITSNCENWVYLNSKEYDHLTEISHLCGNVYAADHTMRPLISPSQLLHLNKKKGEALILAGRNYPLLAEMADIDDYVFEELAPLPLPTRSYCGVKMFSIDELLKKLQQNPGILFREETDFSQKSQESQGCKATELWFYMQSEELTQMLSTMKTLKDSSLQQFDLAVRENDKNALDFAMKMVENVFLLSKTGEQTDDVETLLELRQKYAYIYSRIKKDETIVCGINYLASLTNSEIGQKKPCITAAHTMCRVLSFWKQGEMGEKEAAQRLHEAMAEMLPALPKASWWDKQRMDWMILAKSCGYRDDVRELRAFPRRNS